MVSYQPKNIRTFIGAKDYKESRAFYRDLGFEEIQISEKLILFKINESNGFYLQDYYVKDWIDNSMMFLEVDNADACWEDLHQRGLTSKYEQVRLSEVKSFDWGRQCFLHDPSGVLWHFCELD